MSEKEDESNILAQKALRIVMSAGPGLNTKFLSYPFRGGKALAIVLERGNSQDIQRIYQHRDGCEILVSPNVDTTGWVVRDPIPSLQKLNLQDYQQLKGRQDD